MQPEQEERLRQFFSAYPVRKFEKKEIIARPGEAPPGILFLETGRVAQYDITEEGQEVVINIFQPPAYLPMSWALNKTPNIYFFEAVLDTSTRCAPPEKVIHFLEDNPDILLNLLSRVYRGTEGVLRRMAHALGGTASRLVLFELIVSCKRFGVQTEEGFVVSMTDQELAFRTGLSRETVNRELNELKVAKLVQLGYAKITVPSLEKLEKLLGSHL